MPLRYSGNTQACGTLFFFPWFFGAQSVTICEGFDRVRSVRFFDDPHSSAQLRQLHQLRQLRQLREWRQTTQYLP
ncbi:hypothetical protein GGR50DRAFT_637570 [Xylaria sp. CBS 124048]|nr:hypothetical protein GGR50DRAFT_637570 [Xylaria sp. CBS 124048]